MNENGPTNSNRIGGNFVRTQEQQTPELSSYGNAIERKKRYDYLAKLRTSRFMVRLMASLAVKLAVKNPEHSTDRGLKLAEKRRLDRLWRAATRRQMNISR